MNFRNYDWRAEFNSLSPEEQMQVRNQLRALLWRLGMYVMGFVGVCFLFFRKPARIFGIGPNNELIPMQHPMMGPAPYPAQGMGMYVTPNSNPYHFNAPNNQYAPYDPYHTQNPNQHPYGARP